MSSAPRPVLHFPLVGRSTHAVGAPTPWNTRAAWRDSGGAILVVFPYCLDRIGRGNVQRALSMARHLAASGLAVDLVYQGYADVRAVPELYTTFRRVHRVGAWHTSAYDLYLSQFADFYGSHEPPTENLRPSAMLTTLVRALIESEDYQAVVSSYAWTAPIFHGLTRQVLRIVDLHDVLHQYLQARRDATGETGVFAIARETEEFLWQQWDVLLAITPEDEARIRPLLRPSQHLLCARHAAARFALSAMPGADDVALYAGSDSLTNANALAWLIAQVWPLVLRQRPRATLQIAGSVCAALPPALAAAPGIEIVGFQADLGPWIDRCGIVVAPYLYGSGLKIKVVEAACAGKAIVTTPAGAAGTGLSPVDDIDVHGDPALFADAVAHLLGNRVARTMRGKHALAHARAAFSADACYGPILRALKLFTPPREAPPPPLGPDALERVTLVAGAVRPQRVVVWGNGSHTRRLVAALAAAPVRVDLIVDRDTAGIEVSAEDIPVVRAASFEPGPRDLVVLSSAAFEYEMWNDVAPLRERGAWILGLYDVHHISAGLVSAIGRPDR